MRSSLTMKLAGAVLLAAGAVTTWAEPAATAAKDAPPAKTAELCALSGAACPTNAFKSQTLCPVEGGKISTNLFVDVGRCRIYLCSKACGDKVKADPRTYCGKIFAAGECPAHVKSGEGHACCAGTNAAQCAMMMKSPMCPMMSGANAAAGGTNAPASPMKQ